MLAEEGQAEEALTAVAGSGEASSGRGQAGSVRSPRTKVNRKKIVQFY